MTIEIKRIYEPAARTDGVRVLVDRLWPRGIKKDDARIDLWLKEVAPTTSLRRWFDHRPERWDRFRERYVAELSNNPSLAELRNLAKKKRITLIYSARDADHNQAVVLAEHLKTAARKTTRASP
jgi:uncharacterized protein YeaO (DUF488 family)